MTQRTFDAVRENLDQVLTFLDSQLESWDCPMRVQMQLDVAVEELFVNIASYAYVDKTGIADITIELLPGQVVQITFRDSGIPYNPLEKPDPDITKPAEEREIGSVEIAGWLGLNSKEMWNTFLPELDQSYKEQASTMVGDLMIRQIRKHKAVWYPGAEEMLTALKNRGYHLVILSNCKASYREAHWKEFGMERWFDRFYDCESYRFRPKTEIVQEIIREYSGPYLVVGDRRQDLECARSCKSPFIGCLYGYGEKGELNGADYYAEHIEDILQMVI